MNYAHPAPGVPKPGLARQGRWESILPEGLQPRAQEALQAIYEALPLPGDPVPGPSLSGGHAGFALLHAYAALADPSPHESPHVKRALAHLESAVDQLSGIAHVPWLFAGFTGVAWTVDHIHSLGLLKEEEDLNEEVDEVLLDVLAVEPWLGLPELIAGLAGIGLYGLDRGGRGRGQEIVSRVVERLLNGSEQTPHGLAWFDPPERLHPLAREHHPRGLFNLGVSHGVPGVAGFLAEAALGGDLPARALLDSSLAWMLSCQDLHQNGSRFGAGFARGERPNPSGTRLSWCYGDLGITAILFIAARHTGNPTWERQALELAMACASRPEPRSGILDACLCHGAMGNAHLFNRLYNATGEPGLRDRAVDFYRMGLDLRRDTPEAGGFLAMLPPLPDEAPRDPLFPSMGLLEGCAGIGLALLGGTTSIEPLWDRHLLVHVPPRKA